MPDEQAIEAQRALLQAHRQTLEVLLIQQARLGADYAPPAIANGIADARDAIARAKRALRDWGAAVDDLPDDEAPAQPANAAVGGRLPEARGDIIVGTVGAGAQGVAIGKNIHQEIAGVGGEAGDRASVAELLARLDRELAASAAALDGATSAMAQGYARLLAGELSKAGDRAAPSASAVMLVGDWLLDNVPALRPALAALFAAPAARRVLARADAPLDDWLRRRFGA